MQVHGLQLNYQFMQQQLNCQYTMYHIDVCVARIIGE